MEHILKALDDTLRSKDYYIEHLLEEKEKLAKEYAELNKENRELTEKLTVALSDCEKLQADNKALKQALGDY